METCICEKCGKEFQLKYRSRLCPECRIGYSEVRVCSNCKKEFVATDMVRTLCDSCLEKSRKKRIQKIHPRTYNKIRVIRFLEDSDPPKWESECLVCNEIFPATYSNIKMLNDGCPKCKSKKREDEIKKKLLEENLGKTFGNLTVIGVGEKNKYSQYCLTCECTCGNVSDYPVFLLNSGVKQCQVCSQKIWKT